MNTKQLDMSALKDRILDISRRHRLSHVGSCLSCLPILVDIYARVPDAIVILSNGHAGLALYCVLEAAFGYDAEDLLDQYGVHPRYDPEHHVYCSTGSLGMGLAVAAGYAMAGKTVECVISDGECAEGIVWETLAFLDEHDIPLKVHVNANGWGAYREIRQLPLAHRIMEFCDDVKVWRTTNAPAPDSLAAHYEVPQ